MKWAQWLWFLLIAQSTLAQNLLVDGGFENLLNSSCESPSNTFQFSKSWYVLDANPDLFLGNCPLDESGSFFWDDKIKAFEGKNFAGISSRWNSNATYVSEGIATKLLQPLEAGEIYFFEMAILNRGGYQGFDEDIASCNLRPEKHIDIYLSQDSIEVINNFANGTASTNAELIAILDYDAITSRIPTLEWTVISTCFEAQGGEQHIGIAMPLGTFGDLPPCVAQSTSGVFRSFYYHLDQIQLTTSPSTIREKFVFCEEEIVSIDLIEILDQSLFSNATFLWEDGNTSSKRTFDQAGTYRADAIFECGVAPIFIELRQVKCQPDIYAPTAFSPNDDGINDSFRPILKTDGAFNKYELTIFDRWGNIVYKSRLPQNAWKGDFKNQYLPNSLYLWQLSCEIQTINGIQIVNESGEVLVIR